jgi:hypothetical protein
VIDADSVRDEARHLKAELLGRMFRTTATAVPQQVTFAEVAARRANILGVGFGAKVVGGSLVEDLALRVYVRSKRPRTELATDELVPESVGGRPTDVIAVGDLAALDRPVECGVSVGHIDVTAGTLGCLVELAGAPAGDRFILSNNHVLADSSAGRSGDPILEPAPMDGGDPEDPIAALHRSVEIRFDGTPNEVDAAVARLHDPGDVLPRIRGIGAPVVPPVGAALYMSVRKHGRTTGHTVGVIVDVSADIQVRFGRRTAQFVDQLAVAGVGGPFSDGGDSGSLVVDAVDLHPVGLLFAGGGATTFANPIDAVLSAFSATIVGDEPQVGSR